MRTDTSRHVTRCFMTLYRLLKQTQKHKYDRSQSQCLIQTHSLCDSIIQAQSCKSQTLCNVLHYRLYSLYTVVTLKYIYEMSSKYFNMYPRRLNITMKCIVHRDQLRQSLKPLPVSRLAIDAISGWALPTVTSMSIILKRRKHYTLNMKFVGTFYSSFTCKLY